VRGGEKNYKNLIFKCKKFEKNKRKLFLKLFNLNQINHLIN
jgi:hypothetical protein